MFRSNSTMRSQFLLLLALMLLPAIPAAAQSAQEQAARWPARLVYAAGIVSRGLNPLLDRNGWNEISSVIVSRLVRPDHKGGIEGDLAESWTVSEDGRTYELKLRENVFWHDGKPFTAADVHFTWQRLVDPKTETTLDLNQAMLHSFRTKGTHGFVFTLKAPIETVLERNIMREKIIPKQLVKEAYKLVSRFDYGIVIDNTKKLKKTLEEIISFLPRKVLRMGKKSG